MVNSSIFKVAAASVAAACVLAATFVAGVRIGADESVWLNSTVNGALLVGELRVLRSGNSAKLIQAKELELDAQVLNFHMLESQGHPWLFWPDSDKFERDRYLRSIASYRREFPAILPALDVTSPSHTREAMQQTNIAIEKTTNFIIARYGPE